MLACSTKALRATSLTYNARCIAQDTVLTTVHERLASRPKMGNLSKPIIDTRMYFWYLSFALLW